MDDSATASHSTKSTSTDAVKQPTPILQTIVAWLSCPTATSSSEFLALPRSTQAQLQNLPTFEMYVAAPWNVFFAPGHRHRTLGIILMNPQSRGRITLNSASPTDPPNISINALSHPYDQRAMIEAMKSAMRFSRMPSWAAGTSGVAAEPSSESDEHILEHARKYGSTGAHPVGTCRMGKDDDPGACVTTDFRVRGVDGLRIVDLSVAPVLGNTHTQSIAYLVGETAAEKIVAEHDLHGLELRG